MVNIIKKFSLNQSHMCHLDNLHFLKFEIWPRPRQPPPGLWVKSNDPCDGGFEGVTYNEMGQVMNISLFGKGLTGKLSPAVAELYSPFLTCRHRGCTPQSSTSFSRLTRACSCTRHVSSCTTQLWLWCSNVKGGHRRGCCGRCRCC